MFFPKPTADGSATFFSAEFDELFHSHFGAYQEAEGKFVVPCRLREQAQNRDELRLLDVCYGLGYNSAAALADIWAVNPHCQIHLLALDISDRPAQNAIDQNLLNYWPETVQTPLTQLAHNYQVQTAHLTARFEVGDARQILQHLPQSWQADAIFLDPFSPRKCPQLWTVEFLSLVAQQLQPTGTLATYSCAAAVRAALQAAGLHPTSTAAVGRKAPGTLARWQFDGSSLSQAEQEHLLTRAGIPYRDPQLNATAAEIIERREQEQQGCDRESTGAWKRRWQGLDDQSQPSP